MPPPAAWRDAFAGRAVAASSGTATPTARATELRAAIADLHGVRARAGLRRQRLERGAADAAARLRRRRPHASPRSSRPTSCTATSPASPAPTVVEGERAADFTLDLDEVAPRARRAATRSSRSSARPTTRPAWSSREPIGATRCSTWRPGCVVVDEAYGQFAPWSALDLVDDDRPLVVTRTFSKTWSMAAARLGYLVGPAWLVGRAREGRAAVPPRRGQADRRAPRPALRRRDGGAGEGRWSSERERVAAALAELPVDVWPSGANFVLFRPDDRDGRRGVAGAARPRRARPRLLELAAARRLPAGHRSARPTRTTPSSPRSAEVLGVSRAARRAASGRPRRPTIEVALDLDGTGAHRRSAPASRSTTTCSTSSAATAAST